MTPPRRDRRLRPVVAVLHALGWAHLLLALASIAWIAFFAESTRPTLVLLYAPRVPWLASTLLVGGIALLARARRLAQAHGVLALVVLFPWMGLRVEGASRPRAAPIRLLTYNVFYGKLGRDAVSAEIARADVDVAVLQAADHVFTPLRARLADRAIRRDGEFVIASRFPLVDVRTPPPRPDGVSPPIVEYVVDVRGRRLRLVVVHPYSPRAALFGESDAGSDVATREDQVAEAVAMARRAPDPVVIVGDTNLPPLSRVGRRHLGAFRDAFEEVGLGFGYTFPAKLPWMRIDRVLAGPGVRFLSARVGPRGASDHRPLRVDFELDDAR